MINDFIKMNTKEKIEQRINSISLTIEDFVRRLLKLCESEIEKLFFSNIIYYVFYHQYKFKTGFEVFDDTYNGMFAGFEETYTLNKIGSDQILYGIQFHDDCTLTDSSKITRRVTYIYSIIPQYCLNIFGKEYRIDFAILCKSYENNTFQKEVKIAIECDGFEYHSSKEALQRDTSRNRALTLEGWKVYRFSGTEIYNMITDNQIENLLREIRILAGYSSIW